MCHIYNLNFPKNQRAIWCPFFFASLEILCDFHIEVCTSLSHVLRGCTRRVTAVADSTQLPGWVKWLRNLARLTCFTPWRSEVGCRRMNVRNAQECRWALWIQFKAMRGVRAIEWVLPPYLNPRPKSSFSLQTSSLLMACCVSSRSFYTPEMELLIHYGL